jgi:diguanylate cyclase (GGDEF)-like protein
MDMPFDAVNEIKKYMPNKEMFLDRAREILAAVADDARVEDANVVIIRMDLWHFKSVNDNYGFEVGDKVIVAFFQMLEKALAEASGDAAMCRAGGDEYLGLFVGDYELAEKTAQRVIASAEAYDYAALGAGQKLGCYMGVVVKPVKDLDLRRAIDETHDVLGSVHKFGQGVDYMNTYEIRG